MSELSEFQTRLGYTFRDEGLLRLALTHPSVAHETGAPSPHNQRLEFLGDAVLQLVLTHELYDKFPAFDEGSLTKARAKLVNRRTLAEHARALGLGAHLILGHGEATHGGRERPCPHGRGDVRLPLTRPSGITATCAAVGASCSLAGNNLFPT